MKKIQIAFLIIFLVGCSSSPNIIPTPTSTIIQPGLVPTQTAIPPTQTAAQIPTSTFTPTVTPTAIGGGAGKIAFTSERDGYPEIYVVSADGSNLTKLANDIHPKFGPAWSPDGIKIAFATNKEDSSSLYIMNADGSNPVKLTDTKELFGKTSLAWRFNTGCCSTNWSPDGKKIVFSSSYYSGCCLQRVSTYMINIDGSTADNPTGDEYPVWSPDGKKIVFVSSRCGVGKWPSGICVMNADGTDLINLTQKGGWPAWSPDSKKIVFATDWGGDAKIYVINADGTNPISLTHYRSPWENSPVWSPDGKKIAFNSYRDGNYEIYVMNADGTDLVNLTNNPADDGGAVWSPDSRKIAFVSGRDGNSEIYVIDIDGSNLLRLTSNDANDDSPVWSP